MRTRTSIFIGLATAMMAFGSPALAQEMNHSGTNVPDGIDMNRNIDQGRPDAAPQPDTRSTSVRHRAVRHHVRHVRRNSAGPM